MTKLPVGWELKRLSDCLEKLKSGKKAERGWSPQCLSHPSSDENVWGVLKTTSVQMGEFLPEYNKELPDSLEPKSRLEVNSGDFLVTTTGPRNRCGIVCHVKKTRKKLIFSGKILRFRVNESLILPNWLMYLLMSPEYQSILDKMKVGTSDSSVSIGNQQILELEIPVPHIDEQHKIVELLEDQLSRLDAALADVKQAKLMAAQFRRSLFQAAFTGNLGSGETSFKSKLPDGWETKRLDEIADIVMGQSPPGSSYNEHGEGQPFFQGKTEFGEVHPTVKKYTTAGTKFAKAGDILMSVRAPVGPTNIADIDCVIGRGLAAIRSKTVVSQDYLRWSLKHLEIDIQSKGTGTTFDAITGETLRGTLVALPPIDEQHKIVELLEEHLSRLDASVSLADSMERQSNGLRRSLLQAAFTGQLTKEVASV
jgi:type I restriction enzyme S subunit